MAFNWKGHRRFECGKLKAAWAVGVEHVDRLPA